MRQLPMDKISFVMCQLWSYPGVWGLDNFCKGKVGDDWGLPVAAFGRFKEKPTLQICGGWVLYCTTVEG